jgi:hypothetical protein
MKKVLVILGSVLILIAIPVSIFLVRQNQEMRSKAAPATSLSFNPPSVTKQVGDEFNLAVQIDTGDNAVFVAQLILAYDPTKLEAENITNGPLFPNVLIAGAIDPSGKASITIGSANTTTPVTGQGTAAVIKFKALAPTSGQISVQFVSPDTYVGAKAEDANNVLVGTVPAKITITAAGSQASLTGSPTPTPTTAAGQTSATPTPTPVITPAVTVTPEISGTPAPGDQSASDSADANLTPTPTATAAGTLTILSPSSSDIVSSNQPEFTGKGPPNTVITLTIHSTPRTVTVQTDANGNWSYTPSTPLDPGPHDIIASAADPAGTGTLTATQSIVIGQNDGTATDSGTPVTGDTTWTIILIAAGIALVAAGISIPAFMR